MAELEERYGLGEHPRLLAIAGEISRYSFEGDVWIDRLANGHRPGVDALVNDMDGDRRRHSGAEHAQGGTQASVAGQPAGVGVQRAGARDRECAAPWRAVSDGQENI